MWISYAGTADYNINKHREGSGSRCRVLSVVVGGGGGKTEKKKTEKFGRWKDGVNKYDRTFTISPNLICPRRRKRRQDDRFDFARAPEEFVVYAAEEIV